MEYRWVIWSYRIEHQNQHRNQFSRFEANWFQSMLRLMPKMISKWVSLFFALYSVLLCALSLETVFKAQPFYLSVALRFLSVIDVNLIRNPMLPYKTDVKWIKEVHSIYLNACLTDLQQFSMECNHDTNLKKEASQRNRRKPTINKSPTRSIRTMKINSVASKWEHFHQLNGFRSGLCSLHRVSN